MALIHLDAGVIIGFLDGDDTYHDQARAAMTEALGHGDRLAMAASAFAECLVGPSRRGAESVRVVHDLFERLPIAIVAIDADTATAAAQLRASHRTLRLPDALFIASAMRAEADELVTTDRKWPSARALKLRATIRHL